MDFGRIGRNYLRAALAQEGQFEVVAVNDLSDTATRAHLMKYDSLSGRLGKVVDVHDRNMIVEGAPIQVFGERDPAKLPWGDLDVDIVVESTGRFTKGDDARTHLSTGAPKVIISAPASGPMSLSLWGERGDVRTGRSSRDLQRIVHDELPGVAGEGLSRRFWNRTWPDDDSARLHGRPEPARWSAQGPASCPCRRASHHRDQQRRCQNHRIDLAGEWGLSHRMVDLTNYVAERL